LSFVFVELIDGLKPGVGGELFPRVKTRGNSGVVIQKGIII